MFVSAWLDIVRPFFNLLLCVCVRVRKMLNSSYFNICVTDCDILRKVGCTWLQRVSFFTT